MSLHRVDMVTVISCTNTDMPEVVPCYEANKQGTAEKLSTWR